MQDEELTCIQCGRPFVFTASQRERFRTLGFNDPKRCPECRKKRNRINSMIKPDQKEWLNKRKDRSSRRRIGRKQSVSEETWGN